MQELQVYHVGNSLVRGITLPQLDALVESRDSNYVYGSHLTGGQTLEGHLARNAQTINHFESDNFGDFDSALVEHEWDGVVLLPFRQDLNDSSSGTGTITNVQDFIDLTLTNPDAQGTNFYIYSYWIARPEDSSSPGEFQSIDYTSLWDRSSEGGEVWENRDYYEQLVEAVNDNNPDLVNPVNLIPVGDVFYELDNRIKAGLIPQLDPSQGVNQFYSDGIHLNEFPFTDDPTIGTYIVALTFYATLFQDDPRGLTGSVYGFDDIADAPLLAAVQDAVWDVVSTHPFSGLSQEEAESNVLYRVNAGGPTIAATDGGPDWLADTADNNSAFLFDPGSNNTFSFPAVEPGPSVPSSVPGTIFDTERFDQVGGSNLQYAFDVPATGDYEVRLYLANGFLGTSAPGQRVFDVAIEGSVPSNLNDVDLSAQFGSRIGGVISNVVTVDDGTLNIEFLHEVQNPPINGIEIIQLDGSGSPPPPPTTNPVVSIAATQDAAEPDSDGQFAVSLSEAASTDTAIAYTVAGTATAGVDYAVLPGTVTIPAGELTANIAVAVIDDQLDEPEESVTVTLDVITTGDDDILLGAGNSAAIAIASSEPATPNSAPTFTSSATVSVVEATTAVLTLTADDAEGNELAFSISGGADRDAFAIADPLTGALTFQNAPDFEAPGDADGDNVFEVEVAVTDGTNAPAVQALTVAITDDPADNPDIPAPEAPDTPDAPPSADEPDIFDPEAPADIPDTPDAPPSEVPTPPDTPVPPDVSVNLNVDGIDEVVPSVDVLNIFRVLAGAPQAVVIPDDANVSQQDIVDTVSRYPALGLDMDGSGNVVASVDVLNIFRVLAGAPQAVVIPDGVDASQQDVVDRVNGLFA